jgi:hypothetical protein
MPASSRLSLASMALTREASESWSWSPCGVSLAWSVLMAFLPGGAVHDGPYISEY